MQFESPTQEWKDILISFTPKKFACNVIGMYVLEDISTNLPKNQNFQQREHVRSAAHLLVLQGSRISDHT